MNSELVFFVIISLFQNQLSILYLVMRHLYKLGYCPEDGDFSGNLCTFIVTTFKGSL